MDPSDNPRDPAAPAKAAETPQTPDSANQPSEAPIDEARREKIEALKKAVADGTYHVSADKVADKLIEHMLEPKE